MQGASQSESRRAVLLVALGSALWGTDTVLRRPLTQTLPSSWIVLYEHLALAVVALPALLATRQEWRRLRLQQWAAVLGIAWGGSALATLCFTEAVKTGNPTTAVLLQKLQPLVTVMLATQLLKERLQRGHGVLLFAAMAGAYLVSFGERGLLPTLRPFDVTSALLALTAAILWGSSTVLGRYLSPSLSFTALTALRIAVALPLLLAWNLILGGQIPWPSSAQAQMLVWLALIPGLAALLLYYRGLRHTPAPLAGIAELCFPATSAALNWFFLGARFSPLQAAGFLLIWGSVWLLRLKRGR